MQPRRWITQVRETKVLFALLICTLATIMRAPVARLQQLPPILSASDQQVPTLLMAKYSVDGPIRMNMSDTRVVEVNFRFRKDLIPQNGSKLITVSFRTVTLSPQFSIVDLDPKYRNIVIRNSTLVANKYEYRQNITFTANYIGRAILEPYKVEFSNDMNANSVSQTVLLHTPEKLAIIIIQDEGLLGTIFITSVTVVMMFTYIVMGAQLELEKIERLIRRPKLLILGFLVTSFVMPVVSWLVGKTLLEGQVIYRIGSFIFASCPAALAASLWASLLDEDNSEFAIGLQVVSTLGGLVTMPISLYFMEWALVAEGSYQDLHLQVPYYKLITSLLTLLICIFIGWRFVAGNERLEKLSKIIFRPLLFFFLISIIVFSATTYWHIYRLFDWNITICASVIFAISFLISKVLGYLINGNAGQSLAISISSTYKSSGIAIAVLLVAYGPPDSYVAYVPCLAQILVTSFSMYLFGGLAKCAKMCCHRKRASQEDETDQESGPQRSMPKVIEGPELRVQKPDTSKAPGEELEPLNIVDPTNGQHRGSSSSGNSDFSGNQSVIENPKGKPSDTTNAPQQTQV